MQQASSSEQLRDFAAEIAAALRGLAPLNDPDAVVLRLAATVACALGAEALTNASQGTENTITRIRCFVQAGAGPCTIWATGERASLDDAALRNAVAQRYLDYNDTYVGRAVTHPSDMIAARVVEAGCHSPERVFEGKDGFVERVAGPLAIDADGDARLPRTLLKRYPTQIFIQGLIELARELRPKLQGKAGQVQSIVIGLSRQAVEMLGGARAGQGKSIARPPITAPALPLAPS